MLFKRRRRAPLAEHIRSRRRPRVLSLRRHPALAFLLAHRVATSIAFLAIFLGGLALLDSLPSARAEAYLYPATCLGGWDNPNAAEGVPEVLGLDPSAYDETNAASVGQAASEIFCGSFAGNEIASTSQPTWITLTLSVAAHDPAPLPVVDESALASSTEPDATSTIDDILDAPAAAAGAASSSDPAPAPDETAAPDTPADSGASSLITAAGRALAAFVAPRAYAQAVDPDALLSVEYTLDGSHWQTLGILTEDQLSQASFSIPLEGIASFADLADLQVGVKRLSALADAPTIYLDGMTLVAGVAQGPTPLEELVDTITDQSPPQTLVDGASFTTDEEGQMQVVPADASSTSNIIFYQRYGDGTTGYMAETLAHGPAPLTEYYAPPPPPGDYTMIQYMNDDGAFGCSGISARACANDPHFVEEINFEVNDAMTSTTATSTAP